MEEEEKSRLDQFKEFVEMDPTDTFSRYALAMEYMSISDFENSIGHFREVIRLDPDYSAAYFQAAIASQKADKVDDAKSFLRNGITVAEKKGDWHARDEMKAALEGLGG
jgi:Tfp pilus assembly protein PilF